MLKWPLSFCFQKLPEVVIFLHHIKKSYFRKFLFNFYYYASFEYENQKMYILSCCLFLLLEVPHKYLGIGGRGEGAEIFFESVFFTS